MIKKSFYTIFFASFMALIFLLPAQCAANNTSQASCDQAKELIDSWRGDHAVLEQAKNIIDEIISKDPNYYPAYAQLYRYHRRDGYVNNKNIRPDSLEKAKEALDKAAAINQNYDELYLFFGEYYYFKGDMENGLKSLRKAEELGTANPFLYIIRANFYRDIGLFDKAHNAVAIVLEKFKDNKKALNDAIAIELDYYKYIKKYDKVKELYEYIIDNDPKNAWTRGNYANFLWERTGEFDLAIEQAKKALEIMDYGVGRSILSYCLYAKWAKLLQADNKDEAQVYFEKAYALNSNLGDAMVELGAHSPTQIAIAPLQKLGIPVDIEHSNGGTAITIAVKNGDVKAVEKLIPFGFRLNEVYTDGYTMLLLAAKYGHLDVMKVLLANGADIEYRVKGFDAESFAKLREDDNMLNFIRNYKTEKAKKS